MSTPAITTRRGDDVGLFVAPPGVNALTAPLGQLTLGISTFIPQLMFLGIVAPGSHLVPMGLSRTPVVLITSRQSMAGVPGYEGLTGPLRPSPWLNAQNAYAQINGNGASMTIVSSAFDVRYEVYRAAIT